MDYAADHDSTSSEAKNSDFTDSFFKDEGLREPLLATVALGDGNVRGKGHQRERPNSYLSIHMRPYSTELKEYGSAPYKDHNDKV